MLIFNSYLSYIRSDINQAIIFPSGSMIGSMTDFSHAALPMLLAVSLGAVFLLKRVSRTQDPQEPPLITASIPYIGHAIGMMRSKFNYYVQLR